MYLAHLLAMREGVAKTENRNSGDETTSGWG